MNAQPIRRGHGDSGAALPIVLAFITTFGLLTVALLGSLHTNLRFSSVARAQEQRSYALDAGLHTAIQQLRGDTTLCPAAGSSGPVTSLTINSRQVSVTCRTTSGGATGANGWSVFIPDPSGVLATQSGAASNKTIRGPVYHGGTTPAAWDLQADLSVDGGDVLQRSGANCAAPPRLSFPAPTFYGFSCGAALATPPDPQALPAAIPADAAPPTGNGSCRTFHPGRYSAPPALSSNKNYFESGVYFFDNIGTWTVDAVVYGGQPAPGETRQNSATPCGNDVAGATGVRFILGGNSIIDVGNNGSLELYSRPFNDVPAATIRQVQASDPAPWGAKASTVGVSTPILEDGNGRNSELTIHGLVWVPTARVDLRATNSGVAKLQGGVVTAVLNINSSASVGPGSVDISNGSGTGRRTIVVVATVAAVGDEKALSATAVITIANDQARTVGILSWRIDNP